MLTRLAELVRRLGLANSTEGGNRAEGLVADVPGARSQNDGTRTSTGADGYLVTGKGGESTQRALQEADYSGDEADYDPPQEVDMDDLRSVNSDIVGCSTAREQ